MRQRARPVGAAAGLGQQLAQRQRPRRLDPGVDLLELAHLRCRPPPGRSCAAGCCRAPAGRRSCRAAVARGLERAAVRGERRQDALVGELPGEVERGHGEAVEHLGALLRGRRTRCRRPARLRRDRQALGRRAGRSTGRRPRRALAVPPTSAVAVARAQQAIRRSALAASAVAARGGASSRVASD